MHESSFISETVTQHFLTEIKNFFQQFGIYFIDHVEEKQSFVDHVLNTVVKRLISAETS